MSSLILSNYFSHIRISEFKNKLTTLLLVLIVLLFFVKSFWLNFGLNVFLLFLIFPVHHVNRKFLKAIFIISFPLFIGFLGFFKFQLSDVIRDYYYFLNPLIFLSIGYSLSFLFSTKILLKIFLYLGFFFSLFHVFISFYKLGLNPFAHFTVIRDEVSPGNSLTLLSLFIIFLGKKIDKNFYINPYFKVLAILIHILAFILFGSRTYLTMLLIFLAFLLIKKINRKTILFILIAISLFFIFSRSLTPQGDGISFSGKLMGSFSEIGMNGFSDASDITKKYRGFEAFMTFQSFLSGSSNEQIFGQGFGALIDLKYEVFLGNQYFRFVPVLHNGFLYILIKIGIIGLFLYLIFYYFLFKNVARNFDPKNTNIEFYYLIRFCKASIISLLVSNMVVSSIFNPEFEFLQVFLMAIYSKIKLLST